MNAVQPERITPVRVPAHRNPVLLVFGCTLLGAAAQLFMKMGANRLPKVAVVDILANGALLVDFAVAMAANLPLVAGYSFYAISTALLVLALREGQLSLLYPVISLTYVWVTILSVLLLGESVSPYKMVGLMSIMIGVAVLGRNGRK